MQLRNVSPVDIDAYVRMRCDAEMTAELGGPQRAEDMADKVRRDVAEVMADTSWILMIVDDDDPISVAGTVTLWFQSDHGSPYAEIGWMVLSEFQGRGLAKAAVSEVLRRAARDGRWGTIHAFPSVANAPSNALCRSLGFNLVGQQDLVYADTSLRVNHWSMDPVDPGAPSGRPE